jgi:hypothetical protein
MNFKPTIGKVMGSIAFTIILFWIPLFFIKGGPKILEIINISEPLSTGNIVIFIAEVIFLYLFFSLFHKKSNKLLLVRENDLKKMMQKNQNMTQNNQRIVQNDPNAMQNNPNSLPP